MTREQAAGYLKIQLKDLGILTEELTGLTDDLEEAGEVGAVTEMVKVAAGLMTAQRGIERTIRALKG